MGRAAALKLAIDLMHFPSQVRSVRSAPLPDDVLIVVRIAAGDEAATREAAESAGRSHDVVREAATFFVEQILLYPGADSYRVLGARPEATYDELRRNMAILLRWLHPDRDRQGERAFFVARVTRAWDDLKTQERRAAYDRLQHRSEADKSRLQKKGRSQPNRPRSGQRWKHSWRHGRPVSRRHLHQPLHHMYPDGREGLLRRILLLLFGRSAL